MEASGSCGFAAHQETVPSDEDPGSTSCCDLEAISLMNLPG